MADPRGIGEMPTTGAARPGPAVLSAPRRAVSNGVRPIAIRIPTIQVDTTVERRPVVDGVMSDPTGPWVVSWYGTTGRLGIPGNAVMAGHVDYAGVGPAVFARVGELVFGDRIEVTGEDVQLYRYEVEWSRLYDAVTAPVEEIIGQTEQEAITLITCGGQFVPSRGEYLQRLIVRAHRSG